MWQSPLISPRRTRPEDGLLTERQRQALKMHIDDIPTFMGGIDRAQSKIGSD